MGVDQRGGSGAVDAIPWSLAWERAAYGTAGFYTRGPGAREWPSHFFRTSVHVGAVFHRAVATLLVEVDERLGHPPRLDLVDIGAGRGELASGVLDALPPDIAVRVRPVAVDVHDPPHDLDPRVTWVTRRAPEAVPGGVRGLIIANEWLDDIPLDVVQVDGDGVVRLVLVEHDGVEQLGPRLDDDAAWAVWGLDAVRARGWLDSASGRTAQPLARTGDRAEIGVTRDDAWREVVARLDAGTAVAIDYHLAPAAASGTLTGHQHGGHVVRPVPDGGTNLTAHVDVQSVARAVGASVTSQRDALRALGVSPRMPERALAQRDPGAYADALVTASDASELLDPAGLGGFRWIRLDR